MYKELTNTEITWAKKLIGRIDSSAEKLFEEAVQNGNLVKAIVFTHLEKKGIVSIIKGDDYYSIQVSFEEDLCDYEEIKVIETKIKEVIQNRGNNEVYLNVNGYNTILLHDLMNLGFVRDSYGFEFNLLKVDDAAKQYREIKLASDLIVKAYEDEQVKKYQKLLDDAFRHQNEICGEETDVYLGKYADYARDKMMQAEERKDFFTFWKEQDLVGICFFEQEYLDIIAINPIHQKKGYGYEIMKYCLHNRFFENQYQNVYLYTYFENAAAQRLYLQSGFKLRGFYSENTYKSS